MAQMLKQEEMTASIVAKAKEIMALPAKNPDDIKIHESGSVFVPAMKLHYIGNWKKCLEYAELLESPSFKVFGETNLPKTRSAAEYTGYFIVSLNSDSVLGEVELVLNPPVQKHMDNLSMYPREVTIPLLLGKCSSGCVEFSLSDVVQSLRMKKGLRIHGAMFTPYAK